MSWKICYKFPSCNVDIEIVISLPYKWDWKMGVNVWSPFMLVLLEFRNEMLGFLIVALMKSHDVDQTHRMERPGIPHNHLLRVSWMRNRWVRFYVVGHSLSESLNHAPSVRGRNCCSSYLCRTDCDLLVAWLLCWAGCRHLHVHQNSRQPWDLKWLKTMGNWAWALIMTLGGPNLAG